MKRIITIAAVVLSAVLLGACEAGTIAATDASTYFNETIMPWIISFGVTAGGVASVLVPILGKINRSRKTFDSANEALAEAAKLRGEFEAHKRAVADSLAEYEKEIADIKAALPEINGKLDMLLEIQRLAYLNTPALVADGTAKKIAEVYEHGTDTAEN